MARNTQMGPYVLEIQEMKNACVYVDPVRLPGAVSISIDANGENENFYGAMRS